MEIIRAKHMGFCFGVAGAISMCHKVSSDEKNRDKRIYILGMLVHNEHVVNQLSKQGFKIVEEMDILQGKDELQKASSQDSTLLHRATRMSHCWWIGGV